MARPARQNGEPERKSPQRAPPPRLKWRPPPRRGPDMPRPGGWQGGWGSGRGGGRGLSGQPEGKAGRYPRPANKRTRGSSRVDRDSKQERLTRAECGRAGGVPEAARCRRCAPECGRARGGERHGFATPPQMANQSGVWTRRGRAEGVPPSAATPAANGGSFLSRHPGRSSRPMPQRRHGTSSIWK